jgi:hypothetical protein
MPLLLVVDNRIIIQLKTTLCLVVQEQCLTMSHPERYIQVKEPFKLELIVPIGSRTMKKSFISSDFSLFHFMLDTYISGGVGCSQGGRNGPHLQACGVLFRGRVASRYELPADLHGPANTVRLAAAPPN